MLWCKVSGALTLLVCGLLLSVCAVRILRRRLRHSEAYFLLFCALREEIDRYNTPLCGALRGLDAALLEPCGIGGQIGEITELIPTPTPYLSKETSAMLFLFVKDAAFLSRAALLERLDTIIDCFQSSVSAQKRTISREERVAFFLPLATAAALILFFI